MKFFTIVKAKSERIKNKNFQIIHDKTPLWLWTINRILKDSNDKVYVNTDSNEVIEYAKNSRNIIPIIRSQKHRDWEIESKTKGSPVESMFKDFCDEFTSDEEKVCLFHVTSPFLNKKSILEASNLLDNDYDSVQSVKIIKDFIFKQEDGQIIPLNYDTNIVQRTQDLKPVFMSLGAFFLAKSSQVKKTGKRSPGKNFPYGLNEIESIEIDTQDQLEFARLIAKSNVI